MSTTGRGTSMKFIASPRAGCRKERKCLFQRTGGRASGSLTPEQCPGDPLQRCSLPSGSWRAGGFQRANPDAGAQSGPSVETQQGRGNHDLCTCDPTGAHWNPYPLLSWVPAGLTLMPSILKPRVAVELMVSLHCMYRGLVTARWAFSSSVGASGSTSIIFWYMSLRRLGFFRALVSSSSR